MKLFDKGRALMQSASTLNEGCRTLEDSLKLWDRGDTVLNLALCHRRQGKTATAWTEFNKALNHGTKVNFPEAIVEAKRQRAELAEILSKLTITVPPATAKLEGLTVEVARPDEAAQAWPRELWNTSSVIDPGPVRVRAQAKGYKPFEVQLEIGVHKDVKAVVVTLQIEPPPPPPDPPPKPPVRPVSKRPVWPWIVGASGLALGAAAIGSEIVAVSAGNELNKKCGSARNNCPHDYDFGPARTRELVGYGLFVGLGSAGILALGAAGLGLGLSSRALPPSTSLVVSPTSISVLTTF